MTPRVVAMNLELDDAHVYRLDGIIIPGVTRILEYEGLQETGYFTPEAEKRGTMVHLAIAATEQDCLEDPPDLVIPYLRAWYNFKRDTSFQVRGAEVMMFSRIHWFAGTIDVLGCLKEPVVAILDLKTGEPKDWWRLQLAAYQIMCQEQEPHQSFSRYSLELRADETYRLQPYTDRMDKRYFLAARLMYRYKEGV